ncbi:LuxR C-terminal-related transcriptional regulator [Phytohabitans rumicis]|uniref:LuxR C-terminal-related transcriptional regulator n=1 Tax=Phytohabitans rumicis TaxID=1076125 RepID=UPI0015670A4B|nr:LuxR C-terminal-related transcriptional regulator [Phytohabitans rumicis]
MPTLRQLRDRFALMRLVLVYERLSTEEFTAVRESGVAAVVPYAHGLGGLLSVLRALATGVQPNVNGRGLTTRQREILLLVASGHHVSEIAEMLDISPGTVENHKRRVYAKLSATSAAHAVARAASLGIIDSSPPARVARPSEETAEPAGRSVLAVAVGHPGPVLDRVVTTLIAHRLAVVREHCPQAVAQVHWLRSHRGPVVRVLVNPTTDQWWIGATLGWAAIMVHDGVVDQRGMEQALTHGVLAVVHAEHVERQLVPVLNLAAAGYMVMDPSATGHFTDAMWARSAELPSVGPSLTAREHDILRSIGHNHTVRQTARTLGIAMKTVENAQGHLFRKLGVHNRAAALAKAYALGLLQPNDARADVVPRPI